jgi:hypothetical protein
MHLQRMKCEDLQRPSVTANDIIGANEAARTSKCSKDQVNWEGAVRELYETSPLRVL